MPKCDIQIARENFMLILLKEWHNGVEHLKNTNIKMFDHHAMGSGSICAKLTKETSMEKKLSGKFFRMRSRMAENILKKYIDISDYIIAIVSFSLIANSKLRESCASLFDGVSEGVGKFFKTDHQALFLELKECLDDQSWVAVLYFTTFAWYLLYNSNVKKEFEIIKRLHSQVFIPITWNSIKDKEWVPVMCIALTLLFLALAYSVDNIQLYCVILIALNFADMRGNLTVIRNLTAQLENEKFVPPSSDPKKCIIMKRRLVAERYWIRRPHLERIGGMMLMNMLALSWEKIWKFPEWIEPKGVSYLLVILGVVLNEIVIKYWRVMRDRELAVIDDEEEDLLLGPGAALQP